MKRFSQIFLSKNLIIFFALMVIAFSTPSQLTTVIDNAIKNNSIAANSSIYTLKSMAKEDNYSNEALMEEGTQVPEETSEGEEATSSSTIPREEESTQATESSGEASSTDPSEETTEEENIAEQPEETTEEESTAEQSEETTEEENTAEQSEETTEEENTAEQSEETSEAETDVTIPEASVPDYTIPVPAARNIGIGALTSDIELTGVDWTACVQVDWWGIGGVESFAPNGIYSFYFGWQLSILWDGLWPKIEGVSQISAGDYFVLDIPQNQYPELGVWDATDSDRNYFEAILSSESGSTTAQCGYIIIRENKIYVIFTEAANGSFSIGDARFSAERVLYNKRLVGGEQEVYFGLGTETWEGNITRTFNFEQQGLDLLGSWDAKWAASVSDRSLMWQIGVGAIATTALSGFPWANGNPDDADNFWYKDKAPYWDWGQDIINYDNWEATGKGVYVEDELSPGVSAKALYISARTFVPVSLPDTGYRGGAPPSTEHAFSSYVLADYGHGPQYREDGSPDINGVQSPQKEYSFVRIEQEDGESYAAFKARVLELPYQYGFYVQDIVDPTIGATTKTTVLINFGNMNARPGDSYENEQPIYSDLTDQKYVSGRTVTIGDGQGGEIEVPLPVFAQKAADYCILNGFYEENQRARLESYFTMTYGENNAVSGSVVNYLIDLHVNYSPKLLVNGDRNVSNEAVFHMGSKNSDPRLNECELWGSGELGVFSGMANLNPNGAALYKYDHETSDSLEGVVFQLQTWDATAAGRNPTSSDTASIYWVEYGSQTTDSDGRVLWTGLNPGYYRFYEETALEGYDISKSEGYNQDLGTCVSSYFYVSENGGQIVFLSNVEQTIAKYVVRHFLETESGEYKERISESKTLYGIVGETATVEPLSFSGYEFYEEMESNILSGEILADGTLELHLFYRAVSRFGFIKENERGSPMSDIEFKLYPCTEITSDSHIHIGPHADNSCWDLDNPIVAVSNEDGEVSFEGLYTNGYLLMETKTRNGYQLPQGYWMLFLNAVSGELTQQPFAEGSDRMPAFSFEDGVYRLPNFKKMDIPQSGGLGTHIYIMLGIVIIGTSVILWIVFNKKSKIKTH